MIQKIFFTFIFTLSISILKADVQQDIDSAKIYYTAKKYQEASKKYDAVLKTGKTSAELYFNLGNCYYKMNKIPFAILNYERSILLNPADEDAKYNLELANKLVVDKIEVLPTFFITAWINTFFNLHSSNSWAIIAISSFAIVLALLLTFFLTRILIVKKISFFASIFISLIVIVSIVGASVQKQKITANKSAIITDYSVTVKSSPDEKSTDLFQLHEGTKVFVQDSISTWIEIKLLDGNVGWLKKDNVDMI